MPFQLSPGVQVVEKDLTSIIPAVATSTGAFAGVFPWGPVLDTTLISSENQLVSRFGKPGEDDLGAPNAASFFSAANFLSYTNSLYVVRADVAAARNAVATQSGTVTAVAKVAGGTGYGNASNTTVTFSAPQVSGGITATGTAVITSITGTTVTSVTFSGTLTGFTESAVISNIDGDATTITVTTTAAHKLDVGSPVTISGTTNYNGSYVIASIVGVATTSTEFTIASTEHDFAAETTGAVNGTPILDVAFTGGGGSGAAATATVSEGSLASITVTAGGSGYTSDPTVEITSTAGTTYPGLVLTASRLTNTVDDITITNPGSGYTSAPTIIITSSVPGAADASFTSAITTGGIKINNEDDYLTNYSNGAASVGAFAAKYPGSLGNSIEVQMVDFGSYDAQSVVGGETVYTFNYRGEFDGKPQTSNYAANVNGANDEVHIIVIDKDGMWTGTKGAILEKFAFVSKARDARKSDGTNNYYKDVINTNSKYVWWMDHVPEGNASPTSEWGALAANHTFATLTTPKITPLSGGVTRFDASQGEMIAAYDLFANAELIDISLLITGPAPAAVAKHVIQNIAESRMDCIAFVSPSNNGAVIQGQDIVEDTIAFRTATAFNVNSSYGVLDSGWKYQYDRYNDVYVWVPLNGDVAGLCARTDSTNDAWWSPGGLNRGQIKNVVKLSVNPNRAERDEMYKAGVNPVVSFPGQGTVLFGDKTLLARPSAFDRINVRRLFIVLEKAIATAAKFQLFEFNDTFTRAQFRSIVESFLRDVQGRRGVTGFLVKCDETNNTGEVIDRNEFVADIFIKPARAINFITLNFIATRTGISFEEVGA